MCDRFDISIIGPHDFAASRYINPEKNGERNHFIAHRLFHQTGGLGVFPGAYPALLIKSREKGK